MKQATLPPSLHSVHQCVVISEQSFVASGSTAGLEVTAVGHLALLGF